MPRASADLHLAGNSYARGGILHFLLYDPAYSPSPDPRPSLPLTFIDPSLGRVAARTSWSTSAMAMSYKCSWENINHQLVSHLLWMGIADRGAGRFTLLIVLSLLALDHYACMPAALVQGT